MIISTESTGAVRGNRSQLSLVLTGLGLCAALVGCSAPEHAEHQQHQAPAMQMQMPMGDASLPRADTIAGAKVRRGALTLLPTRPPGSDAATGTAWLATHPGGTTVTVEMSGLKPGEQYLAHLHAKPCSDGNGGGHFKFDPNGPATPPNEVHLAFTADSAGHALMTVNNDRPAENAPSLVVHPAQFTDNRLACADF